MNQHVKSTSQKICKIKQGTSLTELLKKTYLILWDETPIANRNCTEALDKSLKDMHRFNNENNDKKNTRRDDRCARRLLQILPAVPKGRREHIVNAHIKH